MEREVKKTVKKMARKTRLPEELTSEICSGRDATRRGSEDGIERDGRQREGRNDDYSNLRDTSTSIYIDDDEESRVLKTLGF